MIPQPHSKRFFGVEIEAIGLDAYRVYRLVNDLFPTNTMMRVGCIPTKLPPDQSRFEYWQVMKDDTVKSNPGMREDFAFELASPILKISELESLSRVMGCLSHNGAIVNYSCAFQVHVDMRDIWLDSSVRFRAKKNLTLLYLHFEGLLDQWLFPYSVRQRYCQRISNYVPEELACNTNKAALWLDVLNERDFDRIFCSGLNHKPAILFRGGEYKSVEFRRKNGTLDYGDAVFWINLCQALTENAINAARNGQAISLPKNNSWSDLKEICPCLPEKMPNNEPTKNTIRRAGRLAPPWCGHERSARG